MNSSATADSIASRLSTLLALPDAVQAAEQISRLATDPGCARDCVFLVLSEINKVKHMPSPFTGANAHKARM